MRRAVAYLRKSRVTNDRHISWEVQLANVKELAALNGDTDLTVLSDWNRSGTRGADKRPGYADLIRMIEAGEVSTLYSYSLSRLSRSLTEFSRLVDLCQAHDVEIRLKAEPFLDFTSAAGRMMVRILGSFAQMEAEIASERARDTVAIRRARGDRIGGKEFENADAVVQAYRDAGSVRGAATLLTLRGIKTRNGNDVWRPTSVKSILDRVIPDEVRSSGGGRGVKKAAPFMFYRLLLCPCGKFLTGLRALKGKQAGYTSYRCIQGGVDPFHGKQTVPEHVVLDWAMREAALLCPPESTIQMAEDSEAQRSALLERRRRSGRAYQAGAMDDQEFEVEMGEITRELENLDAVGRVVTLEPISWDRDPKDVNAALRALWGHIQMDSDQRPVFAEWRLPDWRRVEEAPGSGVAPAA